MGDKRRFNLLAEFIKARVPQSARIADVAAGKGYLSLALKERGYNRITAFEPEPRRCVIRGLPLLARRFQMTDAAQFDVIVGMHPDGATEEIICGAGKYDKEMFLVPCCAKTSITSYGGNGNKFFPWLNHLIKLCHTNRLEIQRTTLKMDGKNVILHT